MFPYYLPVLSPKPKKARGCGLCFWCQRAVRSIATETDPTERLKLVQTVALRTRAFSSRMVTFWMLGRNMRLVTRWEWLTLRPKDGALPQTSQIFDIILNSVYVPVKNR